MSIEDIFNFRQLNDRLVSGGQPTEEQLRELSRGGFEAVLNIAPTDPRYSLDDEAAVVAAAGMDYVQLPVPWEAPGLEDFKGFVAQMDNWADRKVLVHCAANYRVSAFYALYAMLRLGWSGDRATAFIAERWNPDDYPPWPEFIRRARAAIEDGQLS